MIAPKCKRCGHKPCPACMDWCDRLLRNIYCPECDEVVGEQGDREDGCHMKCSKCGEAWQLALPKEGRKHDDVDIELCCDGECDWDQDEQAVEEWCLRERGV